MDATDKINEILHEYAEYVIGRMEMCIRDRYKIDIKVSPTAIELRFHEDGTGRINIPKKYRNKVVYGDMIQAIAVDLYGDRCV